MAQNWTAKQTGFVQRYQPLVVQLMEVADQLAILNAEFTNDTYGTGGANEIPDAIVQSVLPAATAAQFNSAEGAVVTILATIASNRGYLENMRP